MTVFFVLFVCLFAWPENILWQSPISHRIKLIDFGLSRQLDPVASRWGGGLGGVAYPGRWTWEAPKER